jgi:PPE-repeat protein
VRDRETHLKQLLALLVLAPLVTGCGGASSMFQSDLLSKDAEWFSRPGRLFIRNVSIETPPLTPDKPVTAEDLVSADGGCPGMAPAGAPADANALTDGAAGAPPFQSGTVALGHTECDVVRGIGAPDNVNVSNTARGDRVTVINWSRGARAGIYTFTAGRLTSVERGAEPVVQPKVAKPKAKKKPAAT